MRFFTRALELALVAGDWAAVGACRHRLREMDAWAAQWAAIHSHTPLVEDVLAGLFHIASEGKTGQSSGLQTVVCSSTGAVLSKPEAVQQEVFSFYEAIFQGRREGGASTGRFPNCSRGQGLKGRSPKLLQPEKKLIGICTATLV
jgi:hypothetical protein